MEQNKKVPSIRFNGFEDEYEFKVLDSIAYFYRGKEHSWKDIDEKGRYKVILYGNLYTNYGMIISDVILKTNHISEKTFFGKKNDVLIPSSDTTPIGIARASSLEIDNVILGGDINIIRPIGIDGNYLSLNLNSNKKKLICLIKGSTVRHIDNSDLKKIELYISDSVIEQTLIGNFFKTLDSQINAQEQKHQKLINLKKAMLEKMFPKEGADVPEIRFKGFTEKWEPFYIKDICSISTGKSNTQDKIDNGIYPFYVRSATIERSNRYLYNEEAVLTVGDGVGTGKVFHYVNGKFDLHQRVYRMYNFNNIKGKFFYYIFSKEFYKRVMSMTAKTSVDSVRLEMIADMSILIPTNEEQIMIIDFLENYDNQINNIEAKIEKHKNIKQALLQKMFV